MFTSPAAVEAAAALLPLPQHAVGKRWLAVGRGTAAALLRTGVSGVAAPQRMDSEGLLALDALQEVAGHDIGLVTAPGGRGEIARILGERGARVLRADVYRREPLALTARALQTLLRIEGCMWLALSSGEALRLVIEQLPPAYLQHLLRSGVVAASERLALLARDCGFEQVVIARSARPGDLIRAAANAAEAPAHDRPARRSPIR